MVIKYCEDKYTYYIPGYKGVEDYQMQKRLPSQAAVFSVVFLILNSLDQCKKNTLLCLIFYGLGALAKVRFVLVLISLFT